MAKFKKGDYIYYTEGVFEIVGIVMSGDCANVQNLTLGYKGESDGVVFPVNRAKKLPKWKVEHLKDCGYFQCEYMKRYMVEETTNV
jgi:hypothetical protein